MLPGIGRWNREGGLGDGAPYLIQSDDLNQIPVAMTVKADINADVEVDARGLRCPEPLMVVRNRMMDMDSGQVILVVATDPSTSWDFPNFCKFLNHELVAEDSRDDEYRFWIRKG